MTEAPRSVELPDDEREDAAVAVVLDLDGGVDPHDGLEDDRPAVAPPRLHRDRLAGTESLRDPFDGEALFARQAERLAGVALRELKGKDSHADEVAPVDALVRLGQHGAHAEERGPLRRPVARRSRAVLLPGEDD